MQTITTRASIHVAVEHGRGVISLEAGRRYVMHDVEVRSGQQADAFASVEAVPSQPAIYQAARRNVNRMIVPFIGGMGDAISLLPLLAEIASQHEAVVIDVAATAGPGQVFALCPHVRQVLAHPLTLEQWTTYDSYLALERVAVTQQPGRALCHTFAAAAGISLEHPRFELKIPEAAADSEQRGMPLAAIAVGDGKSLRAYPYPHLLQLLPLLAEQGVACVLFGHADPAWIIPAQPPLVTDMRSATPHVLELAAWLREVDVVIAHDSFLMHLAGAMGRPTIGLFAPTAPQHALPYRSVMALSSDLQCAPCHAIGSACPLGHADCVAWQREVVAPAQVASAVVEMLKSLGRVTASSDTSELSPRFPAEGTARLAQRVESHGCSGSSR